MSCGGCFKLLNNLHETSIRLRAHSGWRNGEDDRFPMGYASRRVNEHRLLPSTRIPNAREEEIIKG